MTFFNDVIFMAGHSGSPHNFLLDEMSRKEEVEKDDEKKEKNRV